MRIASAWYPVTISFSVPTVMYELSVKSGILKETAMTSYTVTLTRQEREQLETIKTKGSHRSQKVLNAIILLNCDQGEYQPDQAANLLDSWH